MNSAEEKWFDKDPKTKFLIREATPAAAGAVSALLRRAFLEFEELYTPQAFLATVQPESGVLARLDEGPLWVVERQPTVIGTVAAICMPDSVMVRGMAVDPDARGLGIGRTLLNLTEDFARKHGYQRLSLYTTAFLKHAIHLYRTSGFQFTGETANPHGTELLRMAKVLDGKATKKGRIKTAPILRN
jgi:N-acetylglutamate synthase-like GNAT family acetyltransferase